MILAGTGHRPHKLGGYSDDVRLSLVWLASTVIRRLGPQCVISGMALGWDQALAEASIQEGVPSLAAVPFVGQESRWPEAAQHRYKTMLARATAVQLVSDVPGAKAMQKRNEWMVDQCDHLAALWDGSFGGTHNCLIYAKRRGRAVENLWSEWQAGFLI